MSKDRCTHAFLQQHGRPLHPSRQSRKVQRGPTVHVTLVCLVLRGKRKYNSTNIGMGCSGSHECEGEKSSKTGEGAHSHSPQRQGRGVASKTLLSHCSTPCAGGTPANVCLFSNQRQTYHMFVTEHHLTLLIACYAIVKQECPFPPQTTLSWELSESWHASQRSPKVALSLAPLALPSKSCLVFCFPARRGGENPISRSRCVAYNLSGKRWIANNFILLNPPRIREVASVLTLVLLLWMYHKAMLRCHVDLSYV